MTFKSASTFAIAVTLTWSALAADPIQTPPSIYSGSVAAAPMAAAMTPATLAPIPSGLTPSPSTASSEDSPGPTQPPGEAAVEVLDPPQPPKYRDLWGRIRAGFAMEEIESPLVARHEAWYLNRPEYVQRMVERSRLYLYFVVGELEKRGMPTEIALLPMIESAYNPQAYSRMRAAGMWQFIPSTGRKYGLQQNFWYDGRRDVLAATRAALDYLQVLHDTFGDWELALAAYNCGEGGLQRAIAKNRAKNKPTNYFSLNMPKETRNYLPKLQAVKNIITNLDTLGFALEPVPDQAYFTVVNAPGHMDVTKAAQLADMPVDEFRSLNPGYNRPVMIKAAARQILLPVDRVEEFQSNLENNAGPLVTWQTYTLKKGETLEKVAARFGIGVERLQEVNGLTRHKRAQPRQMLLVPLELRDIPTNLDETYNNSNFQASPEEYSASIRYRVRPGDTLSSIARKHHTSATRIQAVNSLKSNRLHVGQQLVIYQDYRPARRAATRHAQLIRRASN